VFPEQGNEMKVTPSKSQLVKRRTQPAKGQVVSPRLTALEARIKRGPEAQADADRALQELRDDKVYRDLGYTTFEGYCRERLGYSKSYVSRRIAAVRTVDELVAAHGVPLPLAVTSELLSSERSVRDVRAKLAYVKRQLEAGADPKRTVLLVLEQAQQEREQDRRRFNGHRSNAGLVPMGTISAGPSDWQRRQQRQQERRGLALATWQARLSDLLLDLEELPEADRAAAVAELREEVDGLVAMS
jgi:hypothetical protein